ncbi:MAG: hypothetical protein KatS3mg090_0369 [Patescibacteria group bacterium]|nr:MAG: hypothetical protein KatS3mg090_0369 [Patescibacteria group bacterium]
MDNKASIPLFYSVFENKIIFATSFDDILKIISQTTRLKANLDGLLNYVASTFNLIEHYYTRC